MNGITMNRLRSQLGTISLKGILLYGPRMKWLYEELQKNGNETKIIWSEHNYDPLIAELLTSIDKNSIILLKGSRGMALETVMDGVLKA